MTPDELRHPPIEGSSVPSGSDQAQRYAQRLERARYIDQRKMLTAIVSLTALARVCSLPFMRRALSAIAAALR